MAGPAAAARFAYNRAARIYVTSWLVVSVYVYYKFMLHPDELEGVDWFRSLTLLPQPGRTNAMPVNWTLSFELYFYIMFAVGILFGNRKTLLAVTAFAILLNVWSRMDTSFPAAGFFGSAHIYEFIAGCAVGLLYERGLPPAICGPRDSVLCALSVARAAAAYMVRSHRDRWTSYLARQPVVSTADLHYVCNQPLEHFLRGAAGSCVPAGQRRSR